MSLLDFNGDTVWFCPAKNKYNLSLKSVDEITNGDFTFISKFKVNWDGLDKNMPFREGGIVNKNGKHVGLSVFKFENGDCFVKGCIWTNTGEGDDILNEIVVKINDGDFDINSEINLAFSYSKKDSKIRLIFNTQIHEKNIKGDVIDYSNTWLWVGASNAFKSCDVQYRNYFHGEISFVSIYENYLNFKKVSSIFDSNHEVHNEYKPICVFDFKNQTPFKILDTSMNGNNLVKFDDEWMSILHPE
jgi:hypothetical protein